MLGEMRRDGRPAIRLRALALLLALLLAGPLTLLLVRAGVHLLEAAL